MMGFIETLESKVNFIYFKKKYKIKITCSLENEPMGTAGPLRLAE
jgi:NDP-sugar pyrophosphorylase family protein